MSIFCILHCDEPMNSLVVFERLDFVERLPPVEEELFGDETEPRRELNVRVDSSLLMNPFFELVLAQELDLFHLVCIRPQLEVAAHKQHIVDLVLAEYSVVWHVVRSIVNSCHELEPALV